MESYRKKEVRIVGQVRTYPTRRAWWTLRTPTPTLTPRVPSTPKRQNQNTKLEGDQQINRMPFLFLLLGFLPE